MRNMSFSSRKMFHVLLIIAGIVACTIALSDNGLAITKQEAIEIANQDTGMPEDKLEGYWVEVLDDAQQEWQDYRDRATKRGFLSPKTQRRLEETDTKLQGRTLWLIRYWRKPSPGSITFDGVRWVFVDAHTGEVVASLNP
jgi:hypothetical protein